MEKLRKQIRESFFNPVLHFLPLLVFIVVDEFLGAKIAWKVTFPVAIVSLLYIYFVYNRIFAWNLLFTVLFVVVGLISSILNLLPFSLVEHVSAEFSFMLLLAVYLIYRRRIQKYLLQVVPKTIPMTNNFTELNRFVWTLFLFLTLYVVFHFLFYISALYKPANIRFLSESFAGIIVFYCIYEILRVQIVRYNLLREEWWPIVSEKGKVIGSVQHLSSLNDMAKYMHPVVRVMLVNDGMLLLQKRSNDSLLFPGLWDSAISNHVKMGESIEQCVERTALERYQLQNFRYMHLTNYSIELEKEFHYAFLFVSCFDFTVDFSQCEIGNTPRLKWWTQNQIETELNEGIFTPNFIREFDLLKRSGLLESGKCNCTCRLKEVVYQNHNTRT